MSAVEIKVGSMIYGGWKSSQIDIGIEQIAGTFDLSVSERWPGQDTPRQIHRGERCEVLADGETVITGWVDDAFPEFDATTHEFRVTGRDATGDLVDCSAIHKSGQWAKATLDKIVRDICAPFGIPVIVETDIGNAFDSHSIQEGETAFECIERACRMRAVLPVSDGKGGLVLTRAKDGPAVDDLVEGVNIKRARGEFSSKERYSLYIIKGQDRGSDDNLDAPETHAQVKAEATDSFVQRYRPLIVIAEEHGPHATYKQRAEWERNVRRGRSNRATITVQGWRNARGKLWWPNTMVHLDSASLGVNANLLITNVSLIDNPQSGRIAQLRLADRRAFDLLVGKKAAGLQGKIREKQASEKKQSGEDWSSF
ncbi:hypothetical protein SKTS_13670 [Sulfurimicrobium lacus]|uniref:Tail protein n=1 Tax=Sulfurimicrobium lacus TaxID=2715678 RepID=A0A6F8VBG1_9PROT|nr:contractile injection system protein, VgrG/Pvc8 family [Sulfurimicrobium lacus]BCB26481.1 hypothetical protein SKTS_13670 [Sulfurimicrobium lacus]